MENALFKGDYIIVSKVNYGPRLPRSISDIPWLNLFAKDKILKENSNIGGLLPNDRLDGLDDIKVNDIVVFNHPFNIGEYYVKRCIGLPGEKISIYNDRIFINGQFRADMVSVKNLYKLYYDSSVNLSRLTDSLHILHTEDWYSRKNKIKEIFLTNNEKRQLMRFEGIHFIQARNINRNESNDPNLLWIPKKYSKLSLSKRNYEIYKSAIMQDVDSSIFNGNTYQFNQDYYYLLGDNRSASLDSRAWGFVGENTIVGKAVMVIFSYEKNRGIRWDRLFKVLY